MKVETEAFNIGGLRVNNLRQAEDIVPIAESVEDLQTLVDRLVTERRSYNLQLNASKTQVMTSTGEQVNIFVDGVIFEMVDMFQH